MELEDRSETPGETFNYYSFELNMRDIEGLLYSIEVLYSMKVSYTQPPTQSDIVN